MAKALDIYRNPINQNVWIAALPHALSVIVLVLALFYYWFAIADRYIVFLYYHDMGPFVPDTSPFSRVTSSRYWMAGLVAGGAVMLLHTGVNWLLGCLLRDYRPPTWWQIWAICCVPLLFGVPFITMTVNTPTMPMLNAIQITLATMASLGLALMPGKLAAEQPWDLTLLSLDGGAMAAILFGVSMLERLGWMLGRGVTWPLLIVIVALCGAVVLLLIMTGIRIWRRMVIPSTRALFVAGLIVAYLLLPLAHHIIGTDGYYYISAKDNFFSWSWTLQAAAWLVAAVMSAVVTRWRRYLGTRQRLTNVI